MQLVEITVAGLGGDPVQLESPPASLECRARVTKDVRPQVVQVYHGFEEANANPLMDDSSYDSIMGLVSMRSSPYRNRKVQGQGEETDVAYKQNELQHDVLCS